MPLKDPIANKQYQKEYRERTKESRKKYRMLNRDRINGYKKKYRMLNREKVLKSSKKWRMENFKKNSEYSKQWRLLNTDRFRETRREYDQKKRASDPKFKLQGNIRTSLRDALKRTGSTKKNHTHTYLDCSLNWFVTVWWPSKIQAWNDAYPEHKLDLDSGGIQMDHIKPVRAFEANELHECWHYTNLQPLPAAINLRKSDTWSEADESFWRSNIFHNDEFTAPYLPVDMIKDGLHESDTRRFQPSDGE